MTAHPQAWVIDNAAWADARPRLSVLIPFFRDDPSALLAALDAQGHELGGAVEIVVLDDGSGDEALAARTADTVAAMAAPARFVRISANEGRSKGRNRLMTNGRGRHLLFLDSDMLPDGPSFLADYLALIAAEDPAVAFGGFTLDRTPLDPARAVVGNVVGPVEATTAGAFRPFRETLAAFAENDDLRADVARLSAQNSKLRAEVEKVPLDRNRLAELDGLTSAANRTGYALVAARVVAMGPQVETAAYGTVNSGVWGRQTTVQL